MNDYKKELELVLDRAIENDATDIHFSSGSKPFYRINGSLTHLDKNIDLTSEDTRKFAFSILSEENKEKF